MKNKIIIISLLVIGLFQMQAVKPSSFSLNKTRVQPLQNPQPTAIQEDTTLNYEIVFCLDATGSMSGLISTAKEKIWDIVTGVSQNQEVKKIKLGMIFYRDKGDQFVTKFYPLTENIDSIYTELLAIDANGGGDAPESVNLALHEAVSKMKWSKDASSFRTIFLVGDCPPHMDYSEVKYPESCATANQKNIVINTIKLGTSCGDAIPHFKKIATLTNGTYLQLGQNATDVVINTPYDDSIVHYSKLIDESKIYYGSAATKEVMYLNKTKSIELYDKSSKTSTVSRAQYNSSNAGKENGFGRNELVQEILENNISLDSIKPADLPDELKDLSKEEQLKTVEKLKVEREENMKKLDEYVKQKDTYICTEKAKSPEKESFSEEVVKTLKEQSKKK